MSLATSIATDMSIRILTFVSGCRLTGTDQPISAVRTWRRRCASVVVNGTPRTLWRLP